MFHNYKSRAIALLTLGLCFATSCSKEYDDAELRGRTSKLEQQISLVENNVRSLQTLVEAQQARLYISSIEPFADGLGGYNITLSNGKTLKVYNGAKGADGRNGQDGRPGRDGVDGKDGNPGRDGVDGKDGRPGRDGVDGKDGRPGRDGVDGKNGTNPILAVDASHRDYVLFGLSDGTSLKLPRQAPEEASFAFGSAEDLLILSGQTYRIPCTTSGLGSDSQIRVIAQDGYKAKFIRDSGNSAYIELVAPSPAVDSEIIVLLSDALGKIKMYAMNISAGKLSIDAETHSIERAGGSLYLHVRTNLSYSVEIPQEARSWLSYEKLRALVERSEVLQFRVESNPHQELRSTQVLLKQGNSIVRSLTIVQKGLSLEEMLHGNSPSTLKLSRKLTEEDFRTLREDSYKIEVLDLSDVPMTHLPAGGLKGTNTKKIILPKILQEIPSSFLEGALVEQCDIPETVQRIGEAAFGSSKLKGKLTLPNSLKVIGARAFSGCSGLTGSLTIPNSVKSIGSSAFSSCRGLTGSLTIPNSVKSIGSGAFSGCSGFSGSLTIPNTVTSIEDHAFLRCSGFSGSLTIPNSVTSIGARAFEGCKGFTGSLTIPNSVKSIGARAFEGCRGFTGSLTIPNSVESIGDGAFEYCRGFTGSLTIPNSVTSIGDYAFEGCKGFTGSLTIPNSVKSIGNEAFKECTGFSGSLTIGNSVTSIERSAFSGCSGFSGSLTIPNSVTSIERNAFYGCSGFTGSLTIPNSVTSIGNWAFYGCSGFSGNLTIGLSVQSIGGRAFDFSSVSSMKVYCKATTPPELRGIPFGWGSTLSYLAVPMGTKTAYEQSLWKDIRKTIFEEVNFSITN